MFSFGGNSCQDQQDTPFFEDNDEKPSLFEQASQQFSVYDLFNTNTTKLAQSGFKQNSKQLKKSLILELNEFDKKKAFKEIQSSLYQEQSEPIIAQTESNQIQYRNDLDHVIESKVSKFEDSDMFKKSQNKQDLKKVENKLSKLKINLRQERQRKDNQKGKFDLSKSFAQLRNSNAQNSQNFKFNSKQLSSQQYQPQSKFKFKDSRVAQKQAINISSKQEENKKGNTLQLKFNNQKLRSSRVQESSVENGLKESRQSNPNKFSLSSFSSLLKRSTVQNKSEQNVRDKNNKQQHADSKSIKTIQKKCQPMKEDQMKTQKPINALNNKEEKALQFPKFNKVLGTPFKKEDQQKHIEKKEEQKQQKHLKLKQKPCFNLKMIRQPKKIEQKNGQNEKKAILNNLVRQQINKRQDITTAKILKNTVKEGLTPLKKEPFSFINVKKEENTPKIQKIGSKSSSLLSLRSTQKLNQERVQQNPNDNQLKKSNSVLFTNRDKERQAEIKLHRVEFEKYEEQISSLNEQVENTRRKAKACENSYQEIFLLLAKANTSLNTRFMSQTSLTDTRQKKQ